ncbi:RNA polymerase sigma factor, partial [Singulisphaera rosea]
MAIGNRGTTLGQLDTLFRLGMTGSLTDAQLLDRFRSRRDEVAELAFRELVERHGAMVFRVCRAVLRDVHEAEEAFQATFLV